MSVAAGVLVGARRGRLLQVHAYLGASERAKEDVTAHLAFVVPLGFSHAAEEAVPLCRSKTREVAPVGRYVQEVASAIQEAGEVVALEDYYLVPGGVEDGVFGAGRDVLGAVGDVGVTAAVLVDGTDHDVALVVDGADGGVAVTGQCLSERRLLDRADVGCRDVVAITRGATGGQAGGARQESGEHESDTKVAHE